MWSCSIKKWKKQHEQKRYKPAAKFGSSSFQRMDTRSKPISRAASPGAPLPFSIVAPVFGSITGVDEFTYNIPWNRIIYMQVVPYHTTSETQKLKHLTIFIHVIQVVCSHVFLATESSTSQSDKRQNLTKPTRPTPWGSCGRANFNSDSNILKNQKKLRS